MQARDVFPDGGLLPTPEALLQFRVGRGIGHTAALPAVRRSIRPLAEGLASRSESSRQR